MDELKGMHTAENQAQRHAFAPAYSRWLAARAAWRDPDGLEDEESAIKRSGEVARAERELIFTPGISRWMVWDKIEMLTLCLEEEIHNVPRNDCFALVAPAAIKTDLLRLGIGEGLTGSDLPHETSYGGSPGSSATCRAGCQITVTTLPPSAAMWSSWSRSLTGSSRTVSTAYRLRSHGDHPSNS